MTVKLFDELGRLHGKLLLAKKLYDKAFTEFALTGTEEELNRGGSPALYRANLKVEELKEEYDNYLNLLERSDHRGRPLNPEYEARLVWRPWWAWGKRYFDEIDKKGA